MSSAKAVMVPTEHHVYFNLYWTGGRPDVRDPHETLDAANAAADKGRIACLKIKISTELA